MLGASVTTPQPQASENLQNQMNKSEPLSLGDYKSFFEALGKDVISSATNAKGDIIYVNDRFVEVSQYSREELLGKNHRIVKSGYHSPEFYRDLWKTISSGRVWRGEIKNIAKDGTSYWVDTSIVPALGADGKPEKYVSVRFLITEKKQVEETLRLSVWQVEGMQQALDQFAIVAETDAQGKITYVNDQFCKVAKYSREELLGQDHRIINSKFHPKEFWQGLWLTIQQGNIWRGDIRNRAKDGEIYWVDAIIVPLMGSDGKPEKYLTIRTVITERKRAEAELARRKEELETSLKELDGFAYSVSHDLKAPLRGIGQVVDWLYEDLIDKVSGEQKENMHLMKARVGRMNDLIDGILRYSKLGRQGEVQEQVDLQTLVADVIDSIQPPEGIEVEIEKTLPTLSCVLVQIEQVFQNLVSNAIRYIDKKQGRIRIGCRQNDDEWVFFVEDNGPGIAKEHFERIFRTFQTLQPRDEVEATGIGLSIVKKLAELHNGRVWLESEIGKGSTFFFSLPKGQHPRKGA